MRWTGQALPALCGSLVLAVAVLLAGCETQTNIGTIPNAPGGSTGGTCDLAVTADSRFVITWEDGNGAIYARAYDQSGTPATGQILVSTIGGVTRGPRAAIDDATGNFTVVYPKYVYNPLNSSMSNQIFFQQYSASGTPVAPAQLLGYGDHPDIAMMPGGGFAIVYSANNTSGYLIYVKIYSAAGGWAGAIVVDTSSGTTPTSIGALCTGDIIVGYDSGDPKWAPSYVRRFFPGGMSNGNRITVSGSLIFTGVGRPLVYNPNGSFALVTQSGANNFLNRYDAAGNPKPPELLWNAYSAGPPSISGNRCGQYALIYQAGTNIMMKQYSYADVGSVPVQINQSPLPSAGDASPALGLAANFPVIAFDRYILGPLGGLGGTLNSVHVKPFIPLTPPGAFAGPPQTVSPSSSGCPHAALLGTPAVPGYVYTWSATDPSGTSYLSNPHIAQPTVTYPSQGVPSNSITYVLTISTPGGCCTKTDAVVVTFSPGCTSRQGADAPPENRPRQ